MRLCVVVKRVPDSRAAARLQPDGSAIDSSGLRFVCDPFDEFGVEQAIQLREQGVGVEEIVAVSAGPPESAEALRHALAMGADRAVLSVLPAHHLYDELYLASVLAALIRREQRGFDIVLCGKQNIDNDAGELGPALAEALDWPHVGAVTRLTVDGSAKRILAHRRIEGAEEVFETPMPVLITCEKGLVEPRTPALTMLMKSKKLPIEIVDLADLKMDASDARGPALSHLSAPAARSACRFIEGNAAQMAGELLRALRDEAKVI